MCSVSLKRYSSSLIWFRSKTWLPLFVLFSCAHRVFIGRSATSKFLLDLIRDLRFTIFLWFQHVLPYIWDLLQACFLCFHVPACSPFLCFSISFTMHSSSDNILLCLSAELLCFMASPINFKLSDIPIIISLWRVLRKIMNMIWIWLRLAFEWLYFSKLHRFAPYIKRLYPHE